MSGPAVIVTGSTLIALGVLALRLGWLRARGRTTAPAGWGLILVGLILLASRDGAWGLAVGGLVASAAAFLLLTHGWWVSRREEAPAGRAPRPTLRLRDQGSVRLGRRIFVFLLVVPAAMAVSIAAGLAAQATGRAAGWGEADSNAIGLFVFPLAWTLLVTAMMLRPRPAGMLRPLGGTLAASALLFWFSA